MNKTSRFILVGVLGVAAGIGVDRALIAQQPGMQRTILQRQDVPAGAAYEAVLGISELAPGATSGKHRHPGFEMGYVLEGSLKIEQENGPVLTLKAGDSLKNTSVHTATNTGKVPAKVLAVYVIEKGKPIAEPVK